MEAMRDAEDVKDDVDRDDVDGAIEYTCRLAKINYAFLGIEGHGIMSFALDMSYGTSAQAFGHYALGPNAADVLQAILSACGVDEWGKLKGRTVYAVIEGSGFGGLIRGLAPLPTELGKGFVMDNGFPVPFAAPAVD